MNKIIFQFGLLAFCVSVVLLVGQQRSLMETLSKSTVVFVGVVVSAATVLIASSAISGKPKTTHNVPPASNGASTAGAKSSGRSNAAGG